MNEHKSNIHLYIPSNVKTKIEIFSGFGTSEMMATIIITIISSLMAVLYHIRSDDTVSAVVFVLVMMAISIILHVKDNHNQSIWKFVKHAIIFSISQQSYIYKHLK